MFFIQNYRIYTMSLIKDEKMSFDERVKKIRSNFIYERYKKKV